MMRILHKVAQWTPVAVLLALSLGIISCEKDLRRAEEIQDVFTFLILQKLIDTITRTDTGTL